MSSDEKIIEGGGEGSSHNTPQEITITIMAPSALETTSIESSALVASVTSQEIQPDSSVLVVPSENVGNISVTNENKDLIQTVTETHMGSEDLPVISNISSEDTASGTGNSIPVVNKDGGDENVDDEDLGMDHCLVCDIELSGEKIPVFKSLTTSSHRKVSIFLGGVVGQTLTSRKVHSCSLCVGCFGLLNKLDLLEIQVQETKTTLETNFQETLTKHGGRARRKKPAAAKKSDYVFPKIEADDEDQDAIALEMDETFEPRADDLMEEEHDRKEDRELHDEEWEPNEFKKPRAKRDASSSSDPNGQPKRKRGRPRKDAPKKGDLQLQNSKQGKLTPPSTRRIITVPSIFKKCPHCTTIFMDSTQLDSHLSEQHKKHQKERQCQRCRRRFLTYEDNTACEPCLQNLRQSAVPTRKRIEGDIGSGNVNSFICGHCQITFDSRILVELHCLSTGHSMDKISYFRGNKEAVNYTNNLSPDSNITLRHEISSNSSCIISANRKLTDRNKKGRKRRLIKKNQTVCEICKEDYNSVSSLYSHLRAVHPKLFPYECGVCQRRFTSEVSAKEHERRHAMGELQCPACPLRFSHLTHLNFHARKCHPDFVDFRCQYCSVVTPTVDALLCHIKVRHGDSLGLPADFTCKVCKESFHTGKALATHRSSRHSGTAECNICGAKVGKRYLKKHINAVHTKEKVHKCNECGIEFYSRTSLTGHQRRHHSPRKFFCQLCGKGYVNNVELERHLKVHRNQRDFKCEFCSRSFLKAVDLTYHRRSHTGERPHQCDLCSESFIRPFDLRKHKLKHTTVKKVKRLKYSKKKIDELASSVINQNDDRDPSTIAQEVNDHAIKPPDAVVNSLNESHLPQSPDLPQTLQSFPEPTLVTPTGVVQSQEHLQPEIHQLAPAELQVQQLSVTGLDSSQLESQLELSQVVEDLSSGELLEMSPGLLLEATDVQATDEVIAGNVPSHNSEVQGEVGETSQSSQPVQVIYVVEDILNPSICYHKSLENCPKCKDNYRNFF